jgi:hypothetical protein
LVDGEGIWGGLGLGVGGWLLWILLWGYLVIGNLGVKYLYGWICWIDRLIDVDIIVIFLLIVLLLIILVFKIGLIAIN